MCLSQNNNVQGKNNTDTNLSSKYFKIIQSWLLMRMKKEEYFDLFEKMS